MSNLMTPEKLKLVNAVEEVSVCRLMDELYGEGVWLSHKVKYEDECKAVQEWCEKNNAYYYAMPREHFSVWEARRKAVEAGKTKVVLEDLS